MNGNPRAIVARARERFALQDYFGAVLLLEEVLASEQSYADVHHTLGLAFSMLGQRERALAEFDRALELNPRYLEAHIHRGIVLNELGRLAEAQEAFRRAASYQQTPVAGLPAHVAARLANQHAVLGDAYADAGALDRAIEQYRQAIQLGPDFHDIRYRLARLLLAAGHTLEAREELERTVAAKPGMLDARATLGLACFLAGDAIAARAAWTACAEQEPGDPRIRAYLAMLDRVNR
ncbi:MAG: tetratricopeptide repeat protein [Gemmatimonadota bacterium]